MLTKQDKKYIEDRIEKKIDGLAIIIQKGFEEVFVRLDTKVDKGDFADMKRQIVSLDKRVYSLEGRINTLEFKLVTAPNNRLDRVEDDIRMIKGKLGLN
ncbi:hypothetical protein H6775_01480 [Candidatus Nomurabacteria bacterium]|nr:hypothetical protein [Candidatus Nomurabacteria bacterium]